MIKSKLPGQKESIFAIMSGLARQTGAINLSQGFPDFESDSRLIDLVHKYMQMGMNQYAPMPGLPELSDQIVQKVKRRYGPSLSSSEEITITAGATQAIFNLLVALVQPGDEVILMEPAYDSYLPGVVLAGGIPKAVPFRAPNFEYPWDHVEDVLTEKTRMIVVTNPHNPLGKVMGEYDIDRMRHLAERSGVLFLVDEVYEHLIYDEKQHLSILRYPELYERSIVTYSFGKTFHNTGWKVGYSIAPSPLTREIRKVHQFNVFSVNTPLQYALAEYMEKYADYDDLSTFFQQKRDFLLEGLAQTPFRPLSCEGSYFMLADYGAWTQEKDTVVAERLTREAGVATIPLSPFYSSDYDGTVLRFCFAKKLETLSTALARLRQIE